MPRVTDTRDRLLDAGAALFRQQGYTGTGLKEIAAAGAAPMGSLYHFFPGGKEQLGVEAVTRSGQRYQRLIDLVFDRSEDFPGAVHLWFRLAAEALEKSDFGDGCPIATVALETAGTGESLRAACAAVFDAWLDRVTEELVRDGHGLRQARSLASFALAALEGAIVLARTTRDTTHLRQSATHVADTIAARRAAAGASGE
ncbi:TetR/AcrR family transcriptional regulator [Nocardia iowensis]|uniref:TetR/AcrR family transcriptional regulator n=1 Tax=Nocardia iowensis TaxID=204891 RepID=A0ABX8RXG1_NOCIO|nr:TetR/AcrR family transcriptional regulator [Nocardia iowensis]